MEIHEQQNLKARKGRPQSQQHSPTSATILSSSSSPSSPSSSPEFSFAISLSPSSTRVPRGASVAVDLSPADDIFFHGHLLPLHLLSPLTSPPRPASPFNHLVYPVGESDDRSTIGGSNTSSGSESTVISGEKTQWTKIKGVMQRRKKFLSFFSFVSLRSAKGHKSGEDRDSKEKRKRWLKLDHLRKALKRESRMTDSLLLGESKEDIGFDPEPDTFSGSSSFTNMQASFSVPGSMMASPENYGLRLVAKTETDRSTMEELQAAIQAAIAHCKSSMALEEKHNT
ncbi:BRI1 kinase inhibitor 1-like [Syzygium oleosum]|uniref:BRI1 kinase inhibitor 1-like n=1 Tax=Syzygium oleosum TaxID=219896 RepID=UPI0011D1F176|nr:BRI1 kinase inhibitor 1-like [Syzygium oleosum]